MGLFKRRSRVPDLQPEHYEAVVKIFVHFIGLSISGSRESLAQAEERKALTELDLVTEPLGRMRAYQIVDSFARFSVVNLDDVYILHSHSRYMVYAARFTDEVQRAYESKDLARQFHIWAGQGLHLRETQKALYMHPILAEQLRFGWEPAGDVWAMDSSAKVHLACDYLVAQLLVVTWAQARESIQVKPDALGLACGWILLQWMEWSDVTPEQFEPFAGEGDQ